MEGEHALGNQGNLGYLREALKRDINLFDQDNLNLKKISLS